MNKQKAIDIVKMLFKHAESDTKSGSLHEAEAFTRKAKALMDKFNISKADLLGSASEENFSDLGLGYTDYRCYKPLWSKNRQDWFIVLCDAVVKICSVNIQLTGFDTSCRIFAAGQDEAEAAKEMLDGLLKMASRFYLKLRETEKNLKRGDYLLGFATAVREEAYKPTDDSQALVRLTDALKVRVENLILSQAKSNKEVGNAKLKDQMVDNKSFTEGYYDGSNKDNARLN